MYKDEQQDVDVILSRFAGGNNFAPDDSGFEWKHPELWTPKEIHELVMSEVGVDETYPRGFQILIKLWTPSKIMPNGLERTDHEIKKLMTMCTIGKILRFGRDAFTDPARFPSGPLVTYGEWGLFGISQRQQIGKHDQRLALLSDDRFLATDTNPEDLQTAFEIEHEWADQ